MGLEKFQEYVSPPPVASTRNATVLPVATVCDTGWMVMTGGAEANGPASAGLCPIVTPAEFTATTWRLVALVVTLIAVSRPFQGADATEVRLLDELPPITFHVATSVAPFQMACTVIVPSLLVVAAIVGLVVGAPAQGRRKPRYEL